MMAEQRFQYDVVFSLAGEQKDYVEKVARYLGEHGIKVWFYRFKQVDLWGRNEIDTLSEIFTKSGKYCVLFISKEYAQKVWPNLERQFIQSRWLKDPGYLLPARFDDSLVVGIPDTIGYISLKNLSPEQFGSFVIEKVKGTAPAIVQSQPSFRIPKIKQDFDPLDTRNGWIFHIVENLKDRCKYVEDMSLSHDEIEGAMHVRIKFRGNVLYSLNIYKKAHFPGDNGISFYGVEGKMALHGNASNAFGSFMWSKGKNSVVLKLLDMSLFDILPSGEKEFTKEEFVDALWNKVCDIIDRDY